jgi:hypothetical protein
MALLVAEQCMDYRIVVILVMFYLSFDSCLEESTESLNTMSLHIRIPNMREI